MVEISERLLKGKEKGEWVGVDFDGTLFTYTDWTAWNVFGEPIPAMIDRVCAWHAAGVEVRIVTARIGLPFAITNKTPIYSRELKSKCLKTGQPYSDYWMQDAIQDHLEKHNLPRFKVQCYKDVDMVELWDDRAIQVVSNTGRTLVEDITQCGKKVMGEAYEPISTEGVEYARAICDCTYDEISGARHMGNHFVEMLSLLQICPQAWVPFLEDTILSMATAVAIGDTGIEQQTEEARIATERLFAGIEARLIARHRDYYKEYFARTGSAPEPSKVPEKQVRKDLN